MAKHDKRTPPHYYTIEESTAKINKPDRKICKRILKDNRTLFETAQGSTYNHQTWPGGYIDHVTDGLSFAIHFYKFLKRFGRPLPFSLSDVLLIFFIHDLEKPWKIEIMPDGTVRNRPGLETKEQFQIFREQKLREYGLVLTPELQNAFTYIEGEYRDYSSKRRTMNELAAVCHSIDTLCARLWYDYPKATGYEWYGAGRFRKAV
jgi:hypothetical protein